VDIYPEEKNNGSFVGVAFKYTDSSNYMSFEVGLKFCRIRKVVDGKITMITLNKTCGY
jgi:hypothetical protein